MVKVHGNRLHDAARDEKAPGAQPPAAVVVSGGSNASRGASDVERDARECDDDVTYGLSSSSSGLTSPRSVGMVRRGALWSSGRWARRRGLSRQSVDGGARVEAFGDV